MDTEIVVKGSATLRVMPDRAVLRVEVDGEGQSRDEAYRQAAPLATAVDGVVERHRPAVAQAVTASLTVHPRSRWKRGQSVRTGWRASRTTILEVTEFAALGDLLAELATAGGAVDGPDWVLDPDNPVHVEARRQAAADARARADAYADALGLRVTGLAWLAEPGLRQGGGPDYPVAPAAAGARLMAAGEVEEVIDVTPAEMPVRASVEAGFSYTDAG